MKLSERNLVTGGALGSDQVHIIRSNGDSPETFESYRVPVDELPVSSGPELYDVGFCFIGTPTAGALLCRHMIVRDVDFAANFADSEGYVGLPPGATYAIDVKDDGVTIGTASISSGGAFTFTTTSGTAKTVLEGSRLEFYAPANSPADDDIADISVTLKGSVD